MPFCAHCGVQISDAQHFCANCGQRIGAPAIEQSIPTPPDSTTITNPHVGKMMMLIGGLIMLGGCVTILGGFSAQSGAARGFGILFFFVGIAVYLAGKLQHWWSWE